MLYPEHFLRGIINDQFLVSGLPAGNLFSFQHTMPPRKDNYKECSVTWRDNRKSVQLLLREMTEKGEPTYKEGVGVFSTDELNRMKRKSHCKDKLMFERRKVHGNSYHGNLLIDGTVDKKLCNEIASSIALNCFVTIIPPTAVIKRDGIMFFTRKYLFVPFGRIFSGISRPS